MAKKIGDTGMVLPDAPKLMFENALSGDQALSDQIEEMLRASLGIDDLHAVHIRDLSPEQQTLLEEWQTVTTKARMLPKVDYRADAEQHLPIPFLSAIKAVRDSLPARPVAADPGVIEDYTFLLETAHTWETAVYKRLRDFVARYQDDDGQMSEDHYLRMHLALAVVVERINRSNQYATVNDALRSLQSDGPSYLMGISETARQILFKDVTDTDAEAADNLIYDLQGEMYWRPLQEAVSSHVGTLREPGVKTPWRTMKPILKKLGNIQDEVRFELRRGSEFMNTLVAGKMHSSRRRMIHRGMIEPLTNQITEARREAEQAGHEFTPPTLAIPRAAMTEAALGLKPLRKAPSSEAPADEDAPLPIGTPVDENGKPLEQPRRPVRLDLSDQVAAMDDPDEEESDNATFEDFQFLIEDYGFRGLQIGNYVPQKMRRFLTGAIYTSINDLAETLSIAPTLTALGNPLNEEDRSNEDGLIEHRSYKGMSMGLALGARGRGKAAAHYEPGKSIINLTRDKGAGSLAHEWGHALDFTLSSDLCDFSEIKRTYNDRLVSRVTGRPTGTGVRTISEAYAVYWTVITNRHIMQNTGIDVDEDFERFTQRIMKPEANTAENLAAVQGIGRAMQSIYAEQVPVRQLMRDHGFLFADHLLDMLNAGKHLAHTLASEVHGASKQSEDRQLVAHQQGYLPHLHGEAKHFVDAISDPDFNPLTAAHRLAMDAESHLTKRLEDIGGRALHQESKDAIFRAAEQVMQSSFTAATMLKLGADHGPAWASEFGQTLLAEEEASLDATDRRHNGLLKLKMAHLLVAPPDELKEKLAAGMELLDMRASNLSYSTRLFERELEAPTPHAVESTMATRPASLDLIGSNATMDSVLHARLTSPAQEARQLIDDLKAIEGLRQAMDADGQEIHERRTVPHPRLLQRLARDLNHRLPVELGHLFSIEQECLDHLDYQDDPGQRLHESVPSDTAAAFLRTPEALTRLVEDMDNPQIDHFLSRTYEPETLAAELTTSSMLRERLPDILARPTQGLRYVATLEALQDIKQTLMAANSDPGLQGYDAACDAIDRHAQPFKTPVAQAMPREISDAELTRHLRERTVRRGLRYISRAAELWSTRDNAPEAEKTAFDVLKKQGMQVNRIWNSLATFALEEDGQMNGGKPLPTSRQYLADMTSLAHACDEHAARFAYMTPADRLSVLEGAVDQDLNWTPESLRETMKEPNDHRRVEMLPRRAYANHQAWLGALFKTASSMLHKRDMGDGERQALSVLKGDFRRDLLKGVPQIQTSRMARASAAYEKRQLERNGYLRGGAVKYWAEPVELFARAFETFVYDALEMKGKDSPYLVTVAGQERQTKQAEAREAINARRVLGTWNGSTIRHEDLMFVDLPAEYSFNYPSGHHRDQLQDYFKPLVESLQPCLSSLYPNAMALYEARLKPTAEAAPQADTQEHKAPLDPPAEPASPAVQDAAAPEPEDAETANGLAEAEPETQELPIPPALRGQETESSPETAASPVAPESNERSDHTKRKSPSYSPTPSM